MGYRRLTESEKSAEMLERKTEELAGKNAEIKDWCDLLVKEQRLSEIWRIKEKLLQLQSERRRILNAIDKAKQINMSFVRPK